MPKLRDKSMDTAVEALGKLCASLGPAVRLEVQTRRVSLAYNRIREELSDRGEGHNFTISKDMPVGLGAEGKVSVERKPGVYALDWDRFVEDAQGKPKTDIYRYILEHRPVPKTPRRKR